MSALADTTNTINKDTETIDKVPTEATIEKTEDVVETPAAEEAPAAEQSVETSAEDSADSTVKEAAPTEASAEADVAETAAETVVAETAAEAVVAETAAEAVVAETAAEAVVAETAEATVETTTDAAAEVAAESETADVPMETSDKEVPAEEAKASEEGDVEAAEPKVEETKEQKQEKLDQHLSTGRRFFQTAEFSKAAEMLSQAAALSAELFGELHENSFEPTYLYGRALLELATIEDEILNNALTDIPKAGEGDEEVQDDVVENPENVPMEERAEIKQKVEEALGVVREETIEEETEAAAENANDQQEDNTAVETSDSEKSEEKVDEQKTEEQNVEMEVGGEEAKEEEQEESDEDPEEAEDDDSMGLTWDILEISRCICVNKIKDLNAEENSDAEVLKKWSLNQADVLTSLAEHGIADSKHEQAQNDLLLALEIQKTHLPATSRLLANTNHRLGKAFSGESLFAKAATHYTDAKNILISKVEELKKSLEGADEEAKKETEKEIKELEDILPELDVLITDCLGSEEITKKLKEEAKKELEGVAEAINKLPADEETNDITNMVRRPVKRPATEAEPTEEVKKRKSEDGAPVVAEETAMEDESAVAPAVVASAE